MENGALSISALNLSDAGMYQCVAENKHGVIYSSAELMVLGKVPAFQPSRLLRRASPLYSLPAAIPPPPPPPPPPQCLIISYRIQPAAGLQLSTKDRGPH